MTVLLGHTTEAAELPAAVDWKYLQAMQEIRDQRSCGSCWAFASSTALRAHSEIYQKDRTFSVQEMISCTPNPRECGGTGGCQGATAELAMEYVLKNGCRKEEDLKYMADDSLCPANEFLQKLQGKSSTGMAGWEQLESNKAEPLMRALYEHGPVAVSVATGAAWFFYEGGIMNSCKQDAVVNHAVALVGYGEAFRGDHCSPLSMLGSNCLGKYWEIQNSWGQDWGEHGFLRLARGKGFDEEFCGMDNDPRAGIACKDEPEDPVRVCGMCGILFDSVVPLFTGTSESAKVMLSRRPQAANSSAVSSSTDLNQVSSSPHTEGRGEV